MCEPNGDGDLWPIWLYVNELLCIELILWGHGFCTLTLKDIHKIVSYIFKNGKNKPKKHFLNIHDPFFHSPLTISKHLNHNIIFLKSCKQNLKRQLVFIESILTPPLINLLYYYRILYLEISFINPTNVKWWPIYTKASNSINFMFTTYTNVFKIHIALEITNAQIVYIFKYINSFEFTSKYNDAILKIDNNNELRNTNLSQTHILHSSISRCLYNN